jgi:hypothetical protein
LRPAKILRAGTFTFLPWLLPACSADADPLAWLELPAEVNRRIESQRFVLHTDFDAESAEHYRRVLEGMCRWLEEDWFPDLGERPPLRVLLFADGERMQRWNASHGLPDAAGRYISSADLLVADLGTGIGTALHELVHYYLRSACAHPRTPFVEEGIAAFFEKFLGHLDDDGKLHITVGYFHPGRYAHLLPKYERLHVQDLWSGQGGPDYAVARSFMLFLHRGGHLRPWLDALRTTAGDGRAELEALAGRTLDQLDGEWHDWVAAHPFVFGGDTMLVERSMLLRPAEWQQWLRDHEERLVFDEQQRLWRVRDR